MKSSREWAVVSALFLVSGCGSPSASTGPGTGGAGGAAGGGAPITGQVTISTANATPRAATWGANYWTWVPSFGNSVAGTEAAIMALAPGVIRVGGHNNDNNAPSPFGGVELDAAVAYARAVGAEPMLQVPLLADQNGNPPTATSAADMVTYANVTRGYGVRYFSIGNEPDLYADSDLPGFTPEDYCAAVQAFVPAMKAADPSIYIVGPDLSWKYQAGNDWLTPILTGCGDLLDIVAIHRYPFDAAHATKAAASVDALNFAGVIGVVRNIMTNTGQSAKPLALTETNITWDGMPANSIQDASPGTVPSGLWTADMLGTALEGELWTTLVWSISEGWTLGLITPSPAHVARPSYYAMQLFADHFGPTLLDGPAAPAGVRAYASRNLADDATELVVVNWNQVDAVLTFTVTGTAAAIPATTFTLGALTMTAVEIPDAGVPAAWTYGPAQLAAGTGPAEIAPGL